ncbi:hypothetical protein [Salinisphaera sp. G21_0]|uniref:hypothetical protein n=1 Tax=Salinisphaera sp. G21_0 TaxID=2821094 RepID=UPI001ADC5521|nr:hypothetical protein [Salinisphaera sp. G21_0]MBO9484020.1 hypothetical protein [Salinisphaera sp. G21_0]
MQPEQRLWFDENIPAHHLEYEETRLGWRWRLEAYGKNFYFGSINYPDAETAKIAALEFLGTLPNSAHYYWRHRH